jgi:hypothetical protein
VTLDPASLATDSDLLEQIEKASLRLVAQAIYEFSAEAADIFAHEPDLVQDIGEDVTREALDRLGTSVIPVRLFGKMDYKRARFIFHPDYSLRQALFVDSKAEDISGAGTATIQTAQTSMAIRQRRGGRDVDESGGLPTIVTASGQSLLTTTIFVKYNYRAVPGSLNELVDVAIVALPNGLLQARYNPNATETFWLAGRNAPTLGEAFRVRISLRALKAAANWRVQRIRVSPSRSFTWED